MVNPRKVQDSVSCVNRVFGDPLPGVKKVCMCKTSLDTDCYVSRRGALLTYCTLLK